MIFCTFISVMIFTSYLIIRFWQFENEEIGKIVNFLDMDLNSNNIFCILIVGFVAGVSVSGLGTGAGTIINTILMEKLENYPPTVKLIE